MCTTIPIVTPRLVRGQTNWGLIVDRCPHCGRRHVHGGGPVDGDHDGHRASDCRAGFAIGYFLRLPDSEVQP